ncbi:hypothetical protein IKD57_04115 [Candidatus Saccharibacteria bacterium]|nr:hypothetical protein [Candidatus Saccharibacteria bacterium]
MAKPKNKNVNSKNIHKKRTGSSTVRHSRLKKPDFSRTARKIIIVVIIITMFAVILFLLFKSFSTPEHIIKAKIETAATDYYENFFYTDITKYGTTEKSLAEIMDRYKDKGFSTVSLRQLLLYDSKKYADARDVVTSYCDENKSYVKFYPEPPYEQKNYRIEYHYSCDF